MMCISVSLKHFYSGNFKLTQFSYVTFIIDQIMCIREQCNGLTLYSFNFINTLNYCDSKDLRHVV